MEKKFKREKVLLLSLGHLITDIYPGFLAPLLPLLMVKLDFSITGAAVLNSTLMLATSLSQPLFGHLSDKIKRKMFIVIGPVMSAFFLSGINIPNNYYLLMLFILLGGMGVAAFHPQGAALTNLKSGGRKGVGMGIFVFGGSVGFSLGSLLISGIASVGGLGKTHYAMIPGFIIAFFLYKYFFHIEVPKLKENNTNCIPHAVYYILIFIILLVTVRAVIILGLSTFIPIYLAEKGENIAYGGFTLFLMHSFGAVGGLFGGHIAEKIGEKTVIILSFILPIPLFVLYMVTSGFLSILFIAAGSIVLYSSLPVTISLGQHILPHRIGMVSSLLMGFCWGIAGLVFIGIGAVADVIGVETTMFYLIYAMGIGFLLSLFLLRIDTKYSG
ncbi:MFS transporter [bacterium]|nr:MFS transporter [bacterium]